LSIKIPLERHSRYIDLNSKFSTYFTPKRGEIRDVSQKIQDTFEIVSKNLKKSQKILSLKNLQAHGEVVKGRELRSLGEEFDRATIHARPVPHHLF